MAPTRDRAGGVTVAEEQLLQSLFAEHAGPLLVYVLRLTHGDRQRAEDVVQETLLRARRHPEVLDPARHELRPWLYRVARTLALRARPTEVGDEALASVPADDQSDAVRIYHMRDLNQRTAQVIQEINDHGKPALVTRHGRLVALITPMLGQGIEGRLIQAALEAQEATTERLLGEQSQPLRSTEELAAELGVRLRPYKEDRDVSE
jgi:DNA-directed RNA polymerase specialized sigma24 family protein